MGREKAGGHFVLAFALRSWNLPGAGDQNRVRKKKPQAPNRQAAKGSKRLSRAHRYTGGYGFAIGPRLTGTYQATYISSLYVQTSFGVYRLGGRKE
jgi:hypothetical protein